MARNVTHNYAVYEILNYQCVVLLKSINGMLNSIIMVTNADDMLFRCLVQGQSLVTPGLRMLQTDHPSQDGLFLKCSVGQKI